MGLSNQPRDGSCSGISSVTGMLNEMLGVGSVMDIDCLFFQS